ncbi:hypothetical protein [Lacticaseibacillus hulanensis]|uniref:hypothetical protein n=1 Tax=Lacticaseibacillus hulanensis TaxID=2493111 RepID=UPI000FDAF760|nr:hypothetical protein [Lacticaseibacillus hulanensis]
MKDTELRALIARCSDEVVSAQFTEDKVAKRVTEWREGSKDEPDQAAELTMTLAECRQFTEEVLFKVLSQLK